MRPGHENCRYALSLPLIIGVALLLLRSPSSTSFGMDPASLSLGIVSLLLTLAKGIKLFEDAKSAPQDVLQNGRQMDLISQPLQQLKEALEKQPSQGTLFPT